MIKTIYLKDFTYKKEKYKFKKPLRVTINNFLDFNDCKIQHGEMSIPEVLGGYTQKEPFPEDPKEIEKEVKKYLKTVWDEFLLKQPGQLRDEAEIEYRQAWIDLLKH